MNDYEREAFEAWAIGDDPKVNQQLGRDEDGEYISNVIAACWEAWQASAKAYVTSEEDRLPVAWINQEGEISKERGQGFDWPLFAGDAREVEEGA